MVTTAGKVHPSLVKRAKKISEDWDIPYVSREQSSMATIIDQYKADVFVVEKDRLSYVSQHDRETVFFHPNAAMFRSKQWLKTGKDAFLQAARLERGMTVIDATMGLGADSLLAQIAVGCAGKVIGVEKHPVLAYLLKEGLQTYRTKFQPLQEAMKEISVVNKDHTAFLKEQPSAHVDVVYFDPMFTETIEKSTAMRSWETVAQQEVLTEEAVAEAVRVAKKRVVLKDHFRSDRFQRLGFNVTKRPSAKAHYGTIEIERSNR